MNLQRHDGDPRKGSQFEKHYNGKKKTKPDTEEKENLSDQPGESDSNRSREFSPPSREPEINPSRYEGHNEESPAQPDVFGKDPNVNQPSGA